MVNGSATLAASHTHLPAAHLPIAHLVVRDLVKTYPGQAMPSLHGVNFSLVSGEMMALLGPSGCGKTTILRIIAGLVEPTSGSILLDGRDISATPVHRRNIGMVFQAYALFPHMTIAENVAFGLEMRDVAKAERARLVARALDMVKLADKADRRPKQLSGGQQQRAALARSLVIEPALLLLDEPLSNLDAKLRDEMRAEIREIQRRTGVTTIFVTHDQGEALSMADRVVVMSGGRIEQIGVPRDIYDAPASRFVAGFIGESNFLEGRASGGVVEVTGLGIVRFTGGGKADQVTLMVRPQCIELADQPAALPAGMENRFEGVVEDTVYTGELLTCVVRVGGHALRVSRVSRTGVSPANGDRVAVGWSEHDTTLIPPTLSPQG